MSKKINSSYFNLFNIENDMEQKENVSTANNTVENDKANRISIFDFEQKNAAEVNQSEIKGQITMLVDDDIDSINIDQITISGEEATSNNIINDVVILADEDILAANGILNDEKELDEELAEEIADEIIDKDALTEEKEEEKATQQKFFVEPVLKNEKDEKIIETEDAEDAEEEIEEGTKYILNQDTLNEEADINQIEPPKSDAEEEILVSYLETNSLDEEYTQVTEKEDVVPRHQNILDNLPEYNTIKKKSTMESFETPYVFHGKNGDRVRYRLSLPSDNDPKRNRIKKSTVGWLITIAIALILAFLIRSFVFVIATVDGPSMQPTLTSNDRLFVTKYTYFFEDVKRGDIVICKYNDPRYTHMYVKRVIGLPGELISIIDGVVHINGAPIEEDYISVSRPGVDPYYNMDAYLIPAGHVFVIGDNRNNSADSRMPSNGAISIDLIIGKAQARLFPFNNMGLLEESN